MGKVADAEMRKRISGYKRLNTPRYYMVTFDLKESDGRQVLYNAFSRHIERFIGQGNSFRIIKQCHFIRARFLARDIRNELQTLLSPQDSIIVVRLQPGRSYSLKRPGAGRLAKIYFGALKEDEANS